MKKILILILSSNDINSKTNKYFQEKTWLKNLVSEHYFYRASNVSQVKSNILYLNCSGKFEDINKKTIEAFKYVLKSCEFDYILRTNTSSFIDEEILLKFIENKPEDNFFSGYLGTSSEYPGKNFISGSAFLISKNLVKGIVENQEKLNFELPDDVMISEYLFNSNVEPFITERNDIGSYPKFSNINYELYHTRCRLDVHGLPRILEGFTFFVLSKNYRLHKQNKNPNKYFEYFFISLFHIFKLFYRVSKRTFKFFKIY